MEIFYIESLHFSYIYGRLRFILNMILKCIVPPKICCKVPEL